MYKISSENSQRRRDRFTMADIARSGAPENQTPEERQRNLKARVIRLDMLIQEAKSAGKKQTAKELGMEKAATQDLLLPLNRFVKERNISKSKSEIQKVDYFYEVAKERLPKAVFDQLYHEAMDRLMAGLPPARREAMRVARGVARNIKLTVNSP